jgi:hypothetical protein
MLLHVFPVLVNAYNNRAFVYRRELKDYGQEQLANELLTKIRYFSAAVGADKKADYKLILEIDEAFGELEHYNLEAKMALERFTKRTEEVREDVQKLRYQLQKFRSPMLNKLLERWPLCCPIFMESPDVQELDKNVAFIEPFKTEVARLQQLQEEEEQKKKRIKAI